MLKLRLIILASAAAGMLLPAAHAEQIAAVSAYGAYNAPSEADVLLSRAFDTSPATSMDQVVRQLSLAINQLSRHKIPKISPTVQRLSHAEMEKHVCETNCAIKAWYKPGEGIVLDESVNPQTNAFDRSILLHEMVHYFQDMDGYYAQADPCDRWLRRELDAYDIQNRYLGMVGLPSRVAYVGNNCHTMDDLGKDGIIRRQVFSGAKRETNSDD
jgi:hypothetical protein